MKKLFITAIILLLTISLNAQVGMPRELTCTEEAFTFSTSLGAKWKLITPKMGPVETMENSPYIIPSWSSKAINEMPLPPLLYGKLSNTPNPNHHFDQQKYVWLTYFDSPKFPDKLNYTIPPSYFSRPINYGLLKPGFLINFNPYVNGALYPGSTSADIKALNNLN